MRTLTLLVALIGAVSLFAQESPGTASSLTLTNYLAETLAGTGCSPQAGALGSSGSGVPVCAGIDNNDVWYTFTATTQAAKFTVNTSAFNAVVQVLEVGTLNSIGCVNDNAGNTGEVLRVNTLTIGAQYHLRIHSFDGSGGAFTVCGQFYPQSEVRATHAPVPPVDGGLPGYKIPDQCARNQYGGQNTLIQASRWYFVDVDNGDEFVLNVAGSNSLIVLNSVGALCHGKTYEVRTEVQTDNYWCGTSTVRTILTEAVPVASIVPGVIGQTYTANDQISSFFVGTGNIFEWRFTTDNGNTQFTIVNTPNTTILSLSSVECLRYNRIYTIEVRAQYCGVWGPWSEPGFIFTSTVPYVDLRDQFCNTVQTVNSYILCDFTPNVDSFAWQFAPVDPSDPSMTPIGPAIVTFSSTTTIHLLPVGLTPGTTYRVGTKAIYGLTDGCGTPQEGDYGNFCTITIAGPNTLGVPGTAEDDSNVAWIPTQPNLESESGKLTVYPNPLDQGNLNVVLPSVETEGVLTIAIHDLSGRLIYTEVRAVDQGAQLMQVPRPYGLQPGQYLLSVTGSKSNSVARFVAL